MIDTPLIDFDEIHQDYGFFIAHSTESAAQAAALRSHLAWLARLPGPVRLLDFGCGSGDFLARLLAEKIIVPDRLEVVLVEPAIAQLEQAAQRLAPFARQVSARTDAGDFGEPFDLILANHSFYYMPDPEAVAIRLLRALATGGRLIAALLDRENALAGLWRAGFAATGEAFPFSLAEDLEAIVRCHGAEPHREMIRYRIAFPDTPEACSQILRFLFGRHLAKLEFDCALKLFEPYRRDGIVVIETTYPHIIIHAAPTQQDRRQNPESGG